MGKNKVKLTICGNDYYITTDDEVKYTMELGNEVDDRLAKLLRENPRLSMTQGAVLAALEYADNAKRASQSADHLRSQIQEYLEDAARARTDAEIAKRELERVNKELTSVRARLYES